MKSLRSLILVVLCFALLGGGGLWLLLAPHPTLSERENRALAPRPTLTWEKLTDGRYQAALADFARDHIPLRTPLISLCGLSELALGRAEYNGIFVGKDGFLIPRPMPRDGVVEENLGAYLAFLALCEEKELLCSLILAPRGADILTDKLPFFYDASANNGLFDTVGASAPESRLLLDRFLATSDPSVFHYRTDHHWNTDGAYLAYEAMGSHLGYTPIPQEYFDRETVSLSFFGTSDSKVCLPFSTPDEVVLYRYVGDTLATVTNETQKKTNGFYDLAALETKDCYRVFLGGNTARLSITLPTGEPKPRLLLVKDSYANSLIPFLALHYDLEVIDPRYPGDSLPTILEEGTYDRVLFLFGADTFSEHVGLLS